MQGQRLTRLQEKLGEQGLAALALIPGPSLRYVSGVDFHLMERPIIALFHRQASPALVLPSFETTKAETSPLDFDLFPYSEDPASYAAACAQAVKSLDIQSGTIGVEPLSMRFQEARLLGEAAPQAALAPADEAIGALRARKDETEIKAMRSAVKIAQSALESALPMIRIGMTEQEFAAELTVQLLRAGSEPELPFSPIVASGPNSALPHATASDRQLESGDLLLIDWGARVDGYCSDLTRVFAVGDIEPELERIHALVVEANLAAQAAVQVGGDAGAVDQAARDVIEAGGHGEHFIHRTGHGLGLEAHEPPYIRSDNEQVLETGMAFTIEPGVYVEGRGGVRIEDDVFVTENGAESLSDFPRELTRVV